MSHHQVEKRFAATQVSDTRLDDIALSAAQILQTVGHPLQGAELLALTVTHAECSCAEALKGVKHAVANNLVASYQEKEHIMYAPK